MILDSRIRRDGQSTPESVRGGYDGAKRRKGSKFSGSGYARPSAGLHVRRPMNRTAHR